MQYKIIGDWGTSNLRLHLMKNGEVIETKNGLGIKEIGSNAKEYITSLCTNWINQYGINRIFLSGMGGSKIGIVETPYINTPVAHDEFYNQYETISYNNVFLHFACGISTLNDANNPDVMRGEETQIFGALDIIGKKQGLIILPGTHSKWVKVCSGQIIQFETFPTGELFNILKEHSTFTSGGKGFDEEGFVEGMNYVVKNNKPLSGIFKARSNQLINGKSPNWANGFLSGILIAQEIIENIELTRKYETIYLIGNENLCARYAVALRRFATESEILNGDLCAISGLLQFSEKVKKVEK